MADQNDDGIEFGIVFEPEFKMTSPADEPEAPSPADEGKIPQLKDPIRESFRVPCEPNTVFVHIKGTPYPVIDIEDKGIGFHVDDKSKFAIDDSYYPMKLTSHELEFAIKGRYVHISKYHLGQFICGVSIQNIDEQDEIRFLEFVKNIRKSVLDKAKSSNFSK